MEFPGVKQSEEIRGFDILSALPGKRSRTTGGEACAAIHKTTLGDT